MGSKSSKKKQESSVQYVEAKQSLKSASEVKISRIDTQYNNELIDYYAIKNSQVKPQHRRSVGGSEVKLNHRKPLFATVDEFNGADSVNSNVIRGNISLSSTQISTQKTMLESQYQDKRQVPVKQQGIKKPVSHQNLLQHDKSTIQIVKAAKSNTLKQVSSANNMLKQEKRQNNSTAESSFFSMLSCGGKSEIGDMQPRRQNTPTKASLPAARIYHTEIMNQRYLSSLKKLELPQTDFEQVERSVTTCCLAPGEERQFAAHCSQSSYNAMIVDQDTIIGDYTQSGVLSAKYRLQVVNLLRQLNAKKEYKQETLHIAVSIMDRFQAVQISQQRPLYEGASIATICMLMAAKLEQPISPNFNRMISILPDKFKASVNKKSLIKIEFDILTTLQYDLQWAGVNLYAERFIHLLGLQKEQLVTKSIEEISSIALLSNEVSLSYNQSTVAAAVVTLVLDAYFRPKLYLWFKGSKCEQVQPPVASDLMSWWKTEQMQTSTRLNLSQVALCAGQLQNFLNEAANAASTKPGKQIMHQNLQGDNVLQNQVQTLVMA